ncbi:MAG: FAD-dependent tricarballylate dehydrogenase TcuA [Chloroflexi bacterium]|nr:FAD-dependent tricarballylate dehydrogenase TcuA [Chloroflexota bacterium]
MSQRNRDVVVVGAGNAAMTAALAAREEGAGVLVLERAPEHSRGGNSYFTGGLVRVPFNGLPDILELVPDLSKTESESIDVGQYTREQFYDDFARITDYMMDSELTNVVVQEAFPTLKWLTTKGVRLTLAFGRQAFKKGEKYRFWGGAVLEYIGAGIGLIDMLYRSAQREGVEVWYGARAVKLLTGDGRVVGVRVRRAGQTVDVPAGAVVLACGGFEANPEMRARYLGPSWDLVKVRGTEFNTGDGLRMAFEIGAQPYGHFSGCHAVAWDYNAPPTGDRTVGELFQKHSYPLGIIVNRNGERFVDEGADFRNYTYARYGKEILKQPGMAAFQLFDQKVLSMLREEYRIRQVTKATADTIEGLAARLEIDRAGLTRTVEEYNAAVQEDVPFDPTVKDGRSTIGITPPKSNWALKLDTPPYVGFAVTCGITFTFGGLRVRTNAQVLDEDNAPIGGLYAAGELVGGLFYHNYPGGTGLTSGAVFGRIAGREAARASRAG